MERSRRDPSLPVLHGLRAYQCREAKGTPWTTPYDEYSDWLEEDDEPIDGGFAEPGGGSALRAATPENPRNEPCPNCGAKNVLTPLDVAHGYQCDRCADALERGGY